MINTSMFFVNYVFLPASTAITVYKYFTKNTALTFMNMKTQLQIRYTAMFSVNLKYQRFICE